MLQIWPFEGVISRSRVISIRVVRVGGAVVGDWLCLVIEYGIIGIIISIYEF